jgi:hypothetical protein
MTSLPTQEPVAENLTMRLRAVWPMTFTRAVAVIVQTPSARAVGNGSRAGRQQPEPAERGVRADRGLDAGELSAPDPEYGAKYLF